MSLSVAGRAARVATVLHAGQYDKAGQPYIAHPARVAWRLARAGADELDIAIGWLHDTVEDCGIRVVDLGPRGRYGFPVEVARAVAALTRAPREKPDHYYARVRANERAHRVKMVDIGDNRDPARLALLDLETRARLIQKYAHAWRVLTRP